MNRSFSVLGIVSVVIGLIVLFGALYTVSETEQVVITQFGRPVGDPITQAGLKFKIPVIQKANYFEKRLLVWDGAPNQIPTRDKKYIWVDTTARWRIADALKFLQSVATETVAQGRLDDIINSATRDVITENRLVESVRDSNRILDEQDAQDIAAIAEEALERVSLGRRELEEQILLRASEIAPLYGIELIDVRIKRINYVDEVRREVYSRMISERKRAAEKYRSEGRGRSAEIEGKKQRELDRITSEAYQKAQMVRGEADAEAVRIYADAYGRDPDFYYFMGTLETYDETLQQDTTVIFTTDSDYYSLLSDIGQSGR